MIAELTPLRETRVGIEIYEEGRQEGLREARAETVRLHAIGMAEVGMSVAEISWVTKLPEDEVSELLAQS